MRTKIVLLIIALCLTSFTVIQAQDASPEADSVVCDADLILNLYVAERYLGFGAVRDQLMAADDTLEMVDLTTLDYGQFTPLFDAMMSTPMDSDMSDEDMTAITGLLMMDEAAMTEHMEMMMPDVDMSTMTALEWADVEGEDETCASLRAELRHFYTVLAYQGMTSGSDTGSGTGTGDVVNFSTTLSGGAEVPGPGDEDGTGTAAVTVDMPNGQICYTLNVQNITLPAAAAHIHIGEAGVAGDVVVPLDNAPDASGTSTGCVFVEADLLNEIASTPNSFYVNVHTEDFPGGAVRGQVNGGGFAAAPVTDATAEAEATEDAAAPAPTEAASMLTLTSSLTGTAEVPGPGDDDGTGTATATFDVVNSQICYTLAVQNITLPAAAAHIHRGEAGVSGDVVVPLDSVPDASGASSGCVAVDAALMTEISTNPAGFYFNVHNSDFPDGAVRGQLG